MQIAHFTVNPYPHHHYYQEKGLVAKEETLILKVRRRILDGVVLTSQRKHRTVNVNLRVIENEE